MSKKIVISAVVIGIIAIAVVIAFNKTNPTLQNGNPANSAQNNNVAESAVKEFTITSFVEFVDGKPKPQYSLKEITVNKGDKVKIKITVTSGAHDFKIDEFDIYVDTKELNKEYAVEFIADKAGEFTYYCTKPSHRQNGHWGILKVLDK
jgi:heme/copper-type cytochrome/quinol oxidase subunit 2